jgi:hypothetical protein
MLEIRTVTTLVHKRDEIRALIRVYEKKVAQVRSDLTHVLAALVRRKWWGIAVSAIALANRLHIFGYTNCGGRMAYAKTEREWAERAALHLKAELKRADLTYEELAESSKNTGSRKANGASPASSAGPRCRPIFYLRH